MFVRTEVLTEVTKKIIVFLDVNPCSLVEVYRRFGEAYCLHYKLKKEANRRYRYANPFF
jgi:hypothetical protein